MDDTEMLQTQNRHLERENRSLRRNLRDEFAKEALPGVIAEMSLLSTSDQIAKACYAISDAMLKHRQS